MWSAAQPKALGFSPACSHQALQRRQPDEEPESAVSQDRAQESPAVVVDLLGGGGERGGGDAAELPVATRGQVFAACAKTAAAMGVVAWLVRARAADVGASALGNDPEVVARLLAVPKHVAPASVAAALAAAAGVTAARQALLHVWPAFAAASQRSNRQVLSALSPLDLLWVAAVPGISEEFLFRGALIPATFPDWRGALVAGAAFGVLHVGGGRNWAFAAWAGAVGAVYGAAFLATGDVRVPMAAHTLANLAAAGLWKRGQGAGGVQ
ncbi:hypothetical protein WJX81_000085 [Elliptochloris bilobata]|uniref:CAAX prenyl protease 2/Lysostaphin resistance protein A-like domain-containing protein n=1 Tax=Elliptochloris bilobata TaxID=381761 RepID=A0AAW1RGZ4_9CHLO